MPTTTTKKSTPRRTKRADDRSSRSPSRRDAIAVLKADHRDVEQLFRHFEQAGPSARATKRSLVDKMIKALSIHAAIEEQVLYPWPRDTIEDEESTVLESLEEQHVVKWLLSELEDLDPADERFDAKVAVLTESVRHHVDEEESELFADLRTVATRTELLDLGDALVAAKHRAPTRPHPHGADTPPANVIGGTVNAALDHAREVGKDVVGVLGALGPSTE